MTNQMTAKIRLVRCPRCRQLLQEPDIPVYKCGGCGAVLQAKKFKTDTKDTRFSSDGTHVEGKRVLDYAPDQKDISRLNHGATSSAGGSSPDTSNERKEDHFSDCNGKQSGDKTFSHELPNSLHLTSRENGDLSPVTGEQIEQAQCDHNAEQETHNADQDIHKYGNQFGDSTGKQPGDKIFSHEFPSSPRLTSQQNGDLSPSIGGQIRAPIEQAQCDHNAEQETHNADQDIHKYENQFGDSKGKQPGDKIFSHEFPSSPCLNSRENGDLSPSIGGQIREPIEQAQCDHNAEQETHNADHDTNKYENQFSDSNGKQPGDKIFSHGLPNSLCLTSRENGDLSPSTGDQIEQDQCDYDQDTHNADQDMHRYENQFGDSKRNRSRGRSSSDGFYSSLEFPCHETDDSSPEHQAIMAFGLSNRTTDNCARMEQMAREDCNQEQDKDTNFLSKVSLLTEGKLDENDCSPKGNALEERDQSKCVMQHVDKECNFEGHSKEFPKNDSASLEISSSAVTVPEKLSALIEANSEVQDNLGGHVLGSFDTEDLLDGKETDASDTDENPLDQTIPLYNVDSPGDQHLGASQRMISRGFVHASSEDVLDNLPLVNLSSELGRKNINLSKSPTKSYYGDDGSASSYDGFENRFPGRFSKPPKRKLKQNMNNSSRLQREFGPSANDVLSSNLGMQDQAILGPGSEVQNLARKSSILPEKNHSNKIHQDGLHDPRSYSHSSGSRIREDNDQHVSKLPSIPRYPLNGHRKGNLSHHPFSVFQHQSDFCAADAPSYTEPDKLELLRMVHELKDELNRMHISNSRFPSSVIREDKYNPLFYNRRLAPLEGVSADLQYSRYPGRFSQWKGLPQFHRVPRAAFSGDAADYRRQIECAYLHHHPHDWQCSVQLPSHSLCCNKVHCMSHSSTCYNGQCSTSSSPQHYNSSEFSVWDRQTKSDEQWHRDNEIQKFHLRERYHLAKRHVRPVAGGTPIVACYHCSALLHLPADFLLSGRRCHKLRCNTCRKIMKFSLQSSTHLVPRIADAVAPPPSVVDDDSSGSIRQRNWASTSQSNDTPYAEPLSCTDDYGISFDRSFSTEGEPSLITPPVHPVERSCRNRDISSGNSVVPLDDRKMKSTVGECQKLHTNSLQNLEPVGPSFKRSKQRKSSSGIRQLPPLGGSPLHRLMGYSSPSAVMKI
ncbi:uncharacterized protein LOC113763415 isoform X1 [Coffea eugenioides]|uniref:uncharacterized protein LOC113763415 isoform X1 n=1 Tax=Coffea eugenioides TaxID=49369 RepID=UPI000F6065EB|nr:uncharacterized protein LOC113763415 isoform X1 [Coffea eugenioides]